MNTIKETIEMAKKGDSEARNVIREYYLYLVDYYYEKYKDKITKKEIEKMFDDIINEYYNTENNIHLVLYIHKHLIIILHKRFEAKEIMVRETVLSACKGDKEARNKLIKHFSKVVIEQAKEYDYMEYEDLVQYGMIKLIEYLDILIDEHKNGQFFVNGIPRAIQIYFDKTLRKEVEKWNQPLRYIENDLENKRFDIEFESVVNCCTTNDKRRYILTKYFLENRTYDYIGSQTDMSRENVRKIIKASLPQLKKNYLK